MRGAKVYRRSSGRLTKLRTAAASVRPQRKPRSMGYCLLVWGYTVLGEWECGEDTYMNLNPQLDVYPRAGSVPSGIALHDRLEALDLRNNRLDTIPPEWTNAPTTLVAQAPLVYLRIAGNQFTVSSCRSTVAGL
jgi:hypothetical protein